MNLKQARSIIETLIFASPESIGIKELSTITGIDVLTVKALIKELQDSYLNEQRGMQIVEVASGFRMVTLPENAYYVEQLKRPPRKNPLSRAALETLSIIAYRQPITKGEIDSIRGVHSDGVITSLIERELICEVGRKDAVGRPILYGTTREFLIHFGLKDLNDLPALDEFIPEQNEKNDDEGVVMS